MPSEAFQYLSDEDVGALVAYIRSLPPVDREFPPTRIGPEEPTPVYGKYLADAGGCTGCHGPGLSGGNIGLGKPPSNLTSAGIGTWSEADFVRALREGKRPVGADIDSLFMP